MPLKTDLFFSVARKCLTESEFKVSEVDLFKPVSEVDAGSRRFECRSVSVRTRKKMSRPALTTTYHHGDPFHTATSIYHLFNYSLHSQQYTTSLLYTATITATLNNSHKHCNNNSHTQPVSFTLQQQQPYTTSLLHIATTTATHHQSPPHCNNNSHTQPVSSTLQQQQLHTPPPPPSHQILIKCRYKNVPQFSLPTVQKEMGTSFPSKVGIHLIVGQKMATH